LCELIPQNLSASVSLTPIGSVSLENPNTDGETEVDQVYIVTDSRSRTEGSLFTRLPAEHRGWMTHGNFTHNRSPEHRVHFKMDFIKFQTQKRPSWLSSPDDTFLSLSGELQPESAHKV
jgi:hypothetical protein